MSGEAGEGSSPHHPHLLTLLLIFNRNRPYFHVAYISSVGFERRADFEALHIALNTAWMRTFAAVHQRVFRNVSLSGGLPFLEGPGNKLQLGVLVDELFAFRASVRL